MKIINAENIILGRLATYAAKQSMLGEDIAIINCDKAIVTGNKSEVFARFKQKYARGVPSKGPFIHRSPERLVRRSIRGMLPYKIARGSEAFKRVMCYVGVPAEFEGKDTVELPDTMKKSKLPNTKYVTIKDISRNLGGQQ